MKRRLWIRRQIRVLLVVLSLAGITLVAQPTVAHAHHGGVPDEWHCVWANNADDLCVKMNQFLGWWTGFDVEYRYRGLTFYPVTVQLSFRMTRPGLTGPVVRAESWPDTRLEGPNVNFQRGTWADLPSGTCVTGIALVTPQYWGGGSPQNYEVWVCR